MIDRTHDSDAASWIASANGETDFPIQNLPFGVFERSDGAARCGVAIGDQILDLAAIARLLPQEAQQAVRGTTLNALMSLPAEARQALRSRLFDLLGQNSGGERAEIAQALVAQADCAMRLPAAIGGYTDFYAGIVHATNVGRLLRPENPLMPNYKHVPIGYHGRASSIRPSPTPVRRPSGQLKGPNDAAPRFAPSQRLDYEVELGLWIGKGNRLGDAIPISEAGSCIAGVTLLNDWSARDVQTWEYQPLGPFLAKNFGSTVSPWLVTAEALAPFRVAQARREPDDPAPLPYLFDRADQESGALAIEIEVGLRTAAMRSAGAPAERLGRTSARHLYWTPAQLVAHHSSNGCNLEPGDLLGTGTISSPSREGFGSLMEISEGGKTPLMLANGETRTFLEDGDEIVMTGRCVRAGFKSIGFGECRSMILPAH